MLKTIKIEDKTFSDFALSLTPHPITGEIKTLTNVDSINQSVKTLILLNFNEEFRHPYKGSNIRAQLFELFDGITAASMAQEIRRVIDNYEPRTRFLRAIIKQETDKNRIKITIVHQPHDLQKEVTIDVYIERIR